MQLDKRLSAVAGLVRKGTNFADIGTDHAYLPVYLIKKGVIDNAIAADLRKGPLENARETAEAYNLTAYIQLRLSDGLDNFTDGEVNEIAVAGMGGLLIAQFVERTEWLKTSDVHLILQPMTHAEELRKTLYDKGFQIDKEVAVLDKDKLYIAISAYYCGQKIDYTDFDLIVGKLPLNNDEPSKIYLNHIYRKYNKKLVALKNANKDCEDLEKIVGELKKWQL